MDTQEALLKTKGYLTGLLPPENHGEVEEIIEALTPKTGHLRKVIVFQHGEPYLAYHCTKCNVTQLFEESYCPNCGAR